jgi:hypothetical protein
MLKSSSLCLYSSNLGTFWLKIEQFWPFEEISIFSHGGHLEFQINTIIKIFWRGPSKFDFKCFSGFIKLSSQLFILPLKVSKFTQPDDKFKGLSLLFVWQSIIAYCNIPWFSPKVAWRPAHESRSRPKVISNLIPFQIQQWPISYD